MGGAAPNRTVQPECRGDAAVYGRSAEGSRMREVAGTLEPAFEPVVTAFREEMDLQPAGGAALAIYQHGRRVVHVWAGEASPGRAWDEDTASVLFSCTKGLTSILALQLVQEGLLDLDAPVRRYWPEFGQAGKEDVPVRWLLQHRAGLSAPREDVPLESLLAGEPFDAMLAAQAPLWAPGTGHGYHAVTFGNLVGRVIRAVTGTSIGAAFQSRIAAPLDAASWIGLPEQERARVATLLTDGTRVAEGARPGSGPYWVERALTLGGAIPIGIAGDASGFNDPRFHAAELAAIGGIATADALARIWSATVTETAGVRLLSDDTVRAAMVPSTLGASVWGEPPTWAVRGLGVMVDTTAGSVLMSGDSLGHDGLGGQAGFADRAHGIGFAYISNFLANGPDQQGRWQRIMRALRDVLD